MRPQADARIARRALVAVPLALIYRRPCTKPGNAPRPRSGPLSVPSVPHEHLIGGAEI
jgi:hypothetical protein